MPTVDAAVRADSVTRLFVSSSVRMWSTIKRGAPTIALRFASAA